MYFAIRCLQNKFCTPALFCQNTDGVEMRDHSTRSTDYVRSHHIAMLSKHPASQ